MAAINYYEEEMMPLSNKQKAVLDRMRAGETFDEAYEHEGLSFFRSNQAVFLLRLVDNGSLTVTPTEEKP